MLTPLCRNRALQKTPGEKVGGDGEGAYAEDDKDDKNEDNEYENEDEFEDHKWSRIMKDEDDKGWGW